MSNEIVNATPTVVTKSVTIDKADLTAIFTTRVETQLNKDAAAVNARIKEVNAAIKTAEDGRKKLWTAEVAKHTKAAIDSLTAFSATFGKVEVSGQHNQNDGKVTVSLQSGGGGYGNNMSFTVKADASVIDASKATDATVKTQTELLTSLREELLAVKKRLAGLGTLERQVRAQIATDALSGDEDGRAILAGLEERFGNVGGAIAALPSS